MAKIMVGYDYNTARGIAVQMMLDNPQMTAVIVGCDRTTHEMFIDYRLCGNDFYNQIIQNNGNSKNICIKGPMERRDKYDSQGK